VRLLAISADEPADSRAFADAYGIWFPLLSDPDLAVSRVYAGATSDANALPGVTIIASDGHVVFRQVASAKDDRMTTAELLAAIDGSLATHGPDAAGAGYAAIERAQIRLDVGGGAVHATGTGGTAIASIAGLFPLGHHVLVGPVLGFEPRDAPLDADLEVVLRAPIFANAGALELGLAGGYTPWDDRGANAAARAGIWFAMSPTWSVQLDAGFEVHARPASDVFATIGIGRLFRVR
jgi:hypothetical protein